MRPNSNENEVKNRIKIENSEYNPVPLYRSYGVTTKERPIITKIKVFTQKALATFVLGVVLSAIIIAIIAFTFASGSLVIPTAAISSVTVFLLLKFTKPLRKRIKLIGTLKKLCNKKGYKYGYTLWMSDSVLSTKWSNGKGELILHTNTRVYHIRLFSLRKYRSKLKFESEKEMTLTSYPVKNRLAVIYDFKPKTKKLAVDFGEITPVSGKETVKALIFCPTCEEWSYKYLSSYVPTGNAETVFGNKVYTASGFVSDLCRTEEV